MRNVHYQICFKSKDGNTYAVNLYEEGYVGNIVQLTPAENPFETCESSDENIFAPVRSQSGYIRIIDTDNTIFSQIVPQNNTSLMVRVFPGTYTGTWPNGTFTATTDAEAVWQGFVQAQAYTQPWTEHHSILELPVLSMLGCLEYVFLPSDAAGLIHVNNIMAQGILALEGAETIWQRLVIKTDLEYSTTLPWNACMNGSSLVSEKEYINEDGAKVTIMYGISYKEALSRFCRLFGLTLREDGQTLYMYQLGSTLITRTWTINWRWVNNDGAFPANVGNVPTINLPNDFCSKNNTFSMILGARSVEVDFKIDTSSELQLKFPNSPEDNSPTYQISCSDIPPNNMVVSIIQPHGQTATAIYTYNNVEHGTVPISGTDVWKIFGTSAFSDISIWPNFNDPDVTTPPAKQYLESGAIPSRFVVYPTSEPNNLLMQGMMFNLFPSNSDTDGTRRNAQDLPALLTITSPAEMTLVGGYININFNLYGYWTWHNTGLSDRIIDYLFLLHGRANGYWCELKLQVQVGEYYWTGSSWQTSQAQFIIKCEPGTIISNYSSSFNVDSVGGYYIPVTSPMNGTVTICIIDYICSKNSGGYPTYNNYLDVHTVIINDFLVQFLRSHSITATEDTTNTYYKQIIFSGFSEDKKVNLDFGTYNNNQGGLNFLLRANNEYVQDNSYYTGEVDEQEYPITRRIRPEIRLLYYLECYYKVIRYVYTAVFNSATDWFNSIISYNGRSFIGFVVNRNWKNNRKKIKLIETYTPPAIESEEENNE